MSSENSAGALLEIARIEQRFREPHTRRKVVRGGRQRRVETVDGCSGLRETLEHDGVEVGPVERARRQHRRARVGLVRGIPLFPRVQHASERPDRLFVVRARGGGAVRARDVGAGRGWIRVERETRQCGLCRHGRGDCGGGQEEHHEVLSGRRRGQAIHEKSEGAASFAAPSRIPDFRRELRAQNENRSPIWICRSGYWFAMPVIRPKLPSVIELVGLP